MIIWAIQKRLIFKVMAKRKITSFFTPLESESIKRKSSNIEHKTSTKIPKVVATKEVPTEILSFSLDSNDNFPKKIEYVIGTTWLKELKKEFNANYFKKLSEFLIKQKLQHTIYPPTCDIFSWTTSVAIYDVKVVILGQDPYIRPEQAHGLAFSVRKGVDIPKSLANIYTELTKNIKDFVPPNHGCLNGWADQGVLLLNTCLTVQAGMSNSHKGQGWELLTDAVIKWINENLEHVVFMLWGNNAKKKSELINKTKHLVLVSSHPSPLSAHHGFLGCNHFIKANKYLQEHGRGKIDWTYLP